jgi:hypothetical protein
MFLSEAEEIFDYWQEHPPTYILVGLISHILGWSGPKSRDIDADDVPELSVELSPEEATELGREAELPAPVFSLDAMREKNKQMMLEMARRNAEKRAS